jgi:hypothetical protein
MVISQCARIGNPCMPAVIVRRTILTAVGTLALLASLVLSLSGCVSVSVSAPTPTATRGGPSVMSLENTYSGTGTCSLSPVAPAGNNPCGPLIVMKAPWYLFGTCEAQQDSSISIAVRNNTAGSLSHLTFTCANPPGFVRFDDNGQIAFGVTANGAWTFGVYEGTR